MPNVFQPQFWDDAEGDMWDALDELVIMMLISGVQAGTEALPKAIRVFVDWDLINMRVLDYASKYRYSLIKGIVDTTRLQVQKAMTDWIRSGSSLDALSAALEPIFGAARASRIAATEATRVFASGNREAFESTGLVDEMTWHTAEDELVCPQCGPLDGMHIGIGDIDAIPPAHPNCRCWVQPVVSEKSLEKKLEEILS